LQALARIRLREAKALIDLRMYDGAYYLAGYAVECALKACIAKATQRYEFPEKKRVDASHTHNLRELVKLAKLEDARLEEVRKDAQFQKYWDFVQSWSEDSRYRTHAPDVARALLEAVGNRRHGVIRWITRYW
jgi:HEPN domain-containing protein